MKRLGLVEILVAISITLFIAFVLLQHEKTLASIKQTATLELDNGSENKARLIENFFKSAYDGIRTISFLPGIISIDPLGTNLSGDTQQTVQQIYNMIYENANVSEVYASYHTLDPDKIDPATGKEYAPIFTYDEFVVTQKKAGTTQRDEEAEDEESVLKEEEIYEYRLMREQIAFFKKNYPRRTAFSGRDVPAVLGQEVVTCDNTDFPSASTNDYFRSGLVYSVPFYSSSGELAGIISAVFRSAILSDLMGLNQGERDGLLYSPDHSYSVRAGRQPMDYAQGEVILNEYRESLLFTQKDLNIKDGTGSWFFAARLNEASLMARPDIKKAKSTMKITLAGVLSLSLATGIMFWFRHHTFRTKITRIVESLNAGTVKLDSESGILAESSAQIAERTDSQASSLEEISTSLEEIASMTQSHSENAEKASEMTKELRTSITLSNKAVERMIAVNDRVKNASDETSKINKSINEIAFQTNLLSLNASVEAARAGEAGAGFAVVADEVRNLAMRSAKAAQDTETLINDSQNHSQGGVEVAKEVGELLEQITASIDSISKLVDNVSRASMEQMQGIEQLSTALSFIDSNTQNNVDSAHQLADASKELTTLSQGVNDISSRLGNIVQ